MVSLTNFSLVRMIQDHIDRADNQPPIQPIEQKIEFQFEFSPRLLRVVLLNQIKVHEEYHSV